MKDLPTIDTSQFPLVVINFSGYVPSSESFEKYLAEMHELYLANQGIVVIFDLSTLNFIDRPIRMRYSQWLRDWTELVSCSVIGAAYVIPSVPNRILLRGFFLKYKPIWRNASFRSLAEAEIWAKAILSE
jgi:hypothetical protein